MVVTKDEVEGKFPIEGPGVLGEEGAAMRLRVIANGPVVNANVGGRGVRGGAACGVAELEDLLVIAVVLDALAEGKVDANLEVMRAVPAALEVGGGGGDAAYLFLVDVVLLPGALEGAQADVSGRDGAGCNVRLIAQGGR